MEDVKEKETTEESKSMHEMTMVLGWFAAGIGFIPILSSELNSMFAAPMFGLAVTLFMFSKIVGVLEQIRDK